MKAWKLTFHTWSVIDRVDLYGVIFPGDEYKYLFTPDMVLITNRIEKTLAQSGERAESTGIYHRTMSGARMAEHGEPTQHECWFMKALHWALSAHLASSPISVSQLDSDLPLYNHGDGPRQSWSFLGSPHLWAFLAYWVLLIPLIHKAIFWFKENVCIVLNTEQNLSESLKSFWNNINILQE